jgi:cation transport ATPase
MKRLDDRLSDRIVLLIISAGLIAILLSIVWGLFLNPRTMPNWAENVLVSIATACALKLGDCLSTLVALATGRQVGEMGTKLAGSVPAEGAKVQIDQPANSPVPVEQQ